jgi:hypothetical protein
MLKHTVIFKQIPSGVPKRVFKFSHTVKVMAKWGTDDVVRANLRRIMYTCSTVLYSDVKLNKQPA